MTTDTPRRYRFAAFRRAGLFGNVPPSLLITLAVGVIAGWLAVLSHAPLPLAVTPLLVCGLVAFGRLGGRPIHELLPRLSATPRRGRVPDTCYHAARNGASRL